MRIALLLLISVSLWAQSQPTARVLALGSTDAPNTPVDSPGAGTYSSTQSVTITDATAQFILYTTSGSAPSCPSTGTLYTGAFNISVTTTLKAIGCNGVTGGGVLTSVYTISASEPTFTQIQAKWGTGVTSGSSIAVTLNSAPTTGNAVICAISSYPTTLTITAISDSNSNAYTVTPHSPSVANTNSWGTSLAYLLNAPANATGTITATTSGTITYNSTVQCEEFHRSAGTWTFDADAAGSGGTRSIASPSLTPANTGELLYSYAAINGSDVISTVNSPWTLGGAGLQPAPNMAGAAPGYILAGASGSTAINMTASAAAAWNSIAMALK